MESEWHHSNLPKDDFRVEYFKALDLLMAFIRTRFSPSSFIAFSLISSSQLKDQGIIDEKIVKYIRKIYSENLDEDKVRVKMICLEQT